MNWDSPILYDRISDYWSYDDWMSFQVFPIGTVIARCVHNYEFYGTKCDSTRWSLTTEIRLKLVVEELKVGGQPVPLPNSSPPRNEQMARWVIESQTPQRTKRNKPHVNKNSQSNGNRGSNLWRLNWDLIHVSGYY